MGEEWKDLGYVPADGFAKGGWIDAPKTITVTKLNHSNMTLNPYWYSYFGYQNANAHKLTVTSV